MATDLCEHRIPRANCEHCSARPAPCKTCGELRAELAKWRTMAMDIILVDLDITADTPPSELARRVRRVITRLGERLGVPPEEQGT